jgi:hypothetical protein
MFVKFPRRPTVGQDHTTFAREVDDIIEIRPTRGDTAVLVLDDHHGGQELAWVPLTYDTVVAQVNQAKFGESLLLAQAAEDRR